jgi:hypothetical protein
LKRKATDEILARILIGTDYSIGEKIGEWLKEYSHIEVCYLLKSIQTKLTAIIIDRALLLVIQELVIQEVSMKRS